jgi:D-hydroxyproline dehydrogenase subunit beta
MRTDKTVLVNVYANGTLTEPRGFVKDFICPLRFEIRRNHKGHREFPVFEALTIEIGRAALVPVQRHWILSTLIVESGQDRIGARVRALSDCMNTATYDVVIVGAGIVGAACADEFARRGMRVAVVDREVVGSGATAAGMGHIVVMDDSEAQFALTRYSQQLWQALRRELPGDVEYDQCGTIWVAADEEEMAEVRRKHDHYGQRGVPTSVLDSQALRHLEPNLRDGMAGGLLVAEDAVLYPPCAARFLMERAQKRGAQFRLGAPVTQMGQGRVRLSDGVEISGRIIVNAAGAWAPELTRGIEIKKRKGHLVITDRYPEFLRHQLVELGYLKSAHSVTSDSVAFNVQPRRTGQILIGSSRQYGAEHKEVDQVLLARMLQRAQEYMPGLGPMSAVRTWTGFRAATPDKLPLIGPWPGDKSLFLATGHEGLGITTSLATARILVDQTTGARPEIPIEPYLPSRAGKEVAHA